LSLDIDRAESEDIQMIAGEKVGFGPGPSELDGLETICLALNDVARAREGGCFGRGLRSVPLKKRLSIDL